MSFGKIMTFFHANDVHFSGHSRKLFFILASKTFVSRCHKSAVLGVEEENAGLRRSAEFRNSRPTEKHLNLRRNKTVCHNFL